MNIARGVEYRGSVMVCEHQHSGRGGSGRLE